MTHSDGTPPSNIEIDEISKISTLGEDAKAVNGYRVVGRVVDVMPWFLKVLRIQDFIEVEGGSGTKYSSWTELGGAGAWLAKLLGNDKKVERLFDESFVCLKEYVESGKGKTGGEGEAAK
jgi:hypothetical protein